MERQNNVVTQSTAITSLPFCFLHMIVQRMEIQNKHLIIYDALIKAIPKWPSVLRGH